MLCQNSLSAQVGCSWGLKIELAWDADLNLEALPWPVQWRLFPGTKYLPTEEPKKQNELFV